jgi:transglutaminase-like putative cysteine protease/cytochrome c-type biogenesis protein CcmH/NrfG
VPLLVFALTAGLTGFAREADAQGRRSRNPYDRQALELAAQAERLGASPRAMAPILRIEGGRDWTSPDVLSSVYERLARSRRLSAPVRAYVGALHAMALVSSGEPERATARFDELGYVRSWRVVGPFDNEGKAGFDRVMPPEEAQRAPVVADAEYEGRERPVRYREYPDITRFGYVDLDATMRPYVNVCGFAETFVHADDARPISLWVGAGGAVKVYWNGAVVHSDARYRGPDADRAAALVLAHAGWNRLLVKTCVTDGTWGFYLRLGEADGGPARGLRVDPSGATEASPAPASPPRLPAAPEAPLASLERAVAEHPDDAEAHEFLARFIDGTGADDRAEHRARDLAERAAELGPTAERYLFAASLAESRAEQMRLVAEAERIDPRDPWVRLRRAALVAQGPDGRRSLRMLEGFSLDTVPGVLAARIKAGHYLDLGLTRSALAVYDALEARMPRAVGVTRQKAEVLDSLGRREARVALLRRIVELCYDDFDARKALVSDALEREATSEVQAQLDVLLALTPGRASTLYYVASIYDGLGREADALALYREAIRLTPDEAAAHVAYGKALLRFGQRGPAAAALASALALRPQDADARRLRERIVPAARHDEAYATPIETILARRRASSDRPVSVLHDLTVNTMYENGLSASFHQLAFQVHDDEGARRMRTYAIRFEPGTQWVEIRSARVHRADGSVDESVRSHERALGNPSYRIYYDVRALVLVFPELEPGDTVEIRYRLEDVALRNDFHDYYADLRLLRGPDPVAHLEYVLLSPASRAIYVNEPAMPQLRHEQRVEGETRVDRWLAEDVAPLRDESLMPGSTEIAPYLHVSTYRSWEDVGRFWWGLVRDQLHVNDSLRQTVAELTRDAPDVRTKVARIYDWVLRHTRYVGLEFGIHGFQPYQIAQVVQRGFGDCKDKAALLYAMLEEAGVDARIALVRTRHLGAVAELPASLGIFNHAIAYVPELDLYLDGTAETSGTSELPAADQGATVLVVDEDGAELRRTPVHPPSLERRERRLDVRLAADGSATVEGSEQITGADAAGYRSTYQSEGNREERLQRALGRTFPGVHVERQSFGPLDDFEVPVRFEYEAHVPQLAQRTGDALQVPPSTAGGLTPSLARSTSREHPLEIGLASSYLEERRIHLPSGARVTHLPEGGEARSPFGRLTVRYVAGPEGITVTTELVFERDRIAQSDYPAFRRWTEAADALLRQRITLGGVQ